MDKKVRWKEWCKMCKKNHILTMLPCPSCGVYETPQPVSDKVWGLHISLKYDCDGCEAYSDHLR